MTRLFSIRPAITFRGRKGKGIRGLAGKPTHPPLTDVPVAAYILTAVFDVLSRILGPTGAARHTSTSPGPLSCSPASSCPSPRR
ncbi:MAG: hypothetical protein QOF57_598 [Frankiaceae bacterium]|jgi:hypothetical protein|nr:hypothetical protein [Frankiaceae bacterium]